MAGGKQEADLLLEAGRTGHACRAGRIVVAGEGDSSMLRHPPTWQWREASCSCGNRVQPGDDDFLVIPEPSH